MLSTASAREWTIRRFQVGDSLAELTELLHAAYRQLGDLGFNYTAVDQSIQVTEKRLAAGECLVAVSGRRLVGTITFYPKEAAAGCPWYDRPEVSSLGQFGVLPTLQRMGFGRRLLAAAEDLALGTGAEELALDTAEGATHLVDWYHRCGWRFVEHAHWRGKTYRSVIMSKSIRR